MILIFLNFKRHISVPVDLYFSSDMKAPHGGYTYCYTEYLCWDVTIITIIGFIVKWWLHYNSFFWVDYFKFISILFELLYWKLVMKKHARPWSAAIIRKEKSKQACQILFWWLVMSNNSSLFLQRENHTVWGMCSVFFWCSMFFPHAVFTVYCSTQVGNIWWLCLNCFKDTC